MSKMGLKTGGPLIQPAEDNAKGFFERIDVVLQNDEIMKRQGISYASNTYKYDSSAGLREIITADDRGDTRFFNEGRRGLKFLNDGDNYPWMLKDPRLCITLRTWLPILNFIPAVLFIFRHPLDVALSLHHREGFAIGKGLRMWYVYNRRAIQQSSDLCRVIGSHREIMLRPREEFDRLYEELRRECRVPVPHPVSVADLNDFVDPKLQHGRTADKTCEQLKEDPGSLRSVSPPGDKWQPTPPQLRMYQEVMRAYCGMEDQAAFRRDFVWDQSIMDD